MSRKRDAEYDDYPVESAAHFDPTDDAETAESCGIETPDEYCFLCTYSATGGGDPELSAMVADVEKQITGTPTAGIRVIASRVLELYNSTLRERVEDAPDWDIESVQRHIDGEHGTTAPSLSKFKAQSYLPQLANFLRKRVAKRRRGTDEPDLAVIKAYMGVHRELMTLSDK